jgi:O-antigen/teichoic acid export membrane protein
MKINELKMGALLSYISMGINYLIIIVFTPIMLRILGQSEYGLYNLVASVVAYLGILNFGFGSAYMRYYLKYKVNNEKESISKLNGMFLIVFSLIGLIAVVAGIILAFNTEFVFGSELTFRELSTAKTLMMILVLNLGISFPSIIFTSHIVANEKFIFQKILQMIKIIVSPFVILPFLILGYGSIGMVLATTFVNLIIEIINVTYCIKTLNMKFSFKGFDFKLMREMTIFSSFIFINLIIDQVNWNVDKFILGRFRGTAVVAVYGLATYLNTYYLMLSTTISSVFVPRVHKIVSTSNDNKVLTDIFVKVGRIQFIILSLALSGFIFFGRPFISMWAGEEYIEVYVIFLLLTFTGSLSSTIQNIGIEIQRAKNMHKFRSWIYLVIAIGNIAISIPLAKNFGAIGAAIGTALAIFIGNGLIMNWYYHNKVGLDIKRFYKEIISFIPSLIIPIIIGLLISNLDLYNIMNFLIYGFIYVIIFVTSMWFIGMNQFERNLIIIPFKKIIKRISKSN